MEKPSGSLIADIKAEQTVYVQCPLKAIQAQLNEDDVLELVQALGDSTLQGTAIAKALTKRGYKIGEKAVQRHRRFLCGCAR